MKEKFLRKPGAEDDDRKKKEKMDRKEKEKRRVRRVEEEEAEAEADQNAEGWQVPKKGGKGGVPMLAKPKMFAKDADINTAVVLKKLSEILAARGKKGNRTNT